MNRGSTSASVAQPYTPFFRFQRLLDKEGQQILKVELQFEFGDEIFLFNPFPAMWSWRYIGCGASSRSSGSKLINISHIFQHVCHAY